MRYRQLVNNNDWSPSFYLDQPEAVAQAVQTRLGLWQGEWWLDSSAGTPWLQSILGRRANLGDLYIRRVILETQGVVSIANYSSSFEPGTRKLSISATMNTLYGQTQVTI